MVNNCHKLVVR